MKKNMLMEFWALVAGYCIIRMWINYEDERYGWAALMAITACIALDNFAQLSREDK